MLLHSPFSRIALLCATVASAAHHPGPPSTRSGARPLHTPVRPAHRPQSPARSLPLLHPSGVGAPTRGLVAGRRHSPPTGACTCTSIAPRRPCPSCISCRQPACRSSASLWAPGRRARAWTRASSRRSPASRGAAIRSFVPGRAPLAASRTEGDAARGRTCSGRRASTEPSWCWASSPTAIYSLQIAGREHLPAVRSRPTHAARVASGTKARHSSRIVPYVLLPARSSCFSGPLASLDMIDSVECLSTPARNVIVEKRTPLFFLGVLRLAYFVEGWPQVATAFDAAVASRRFVSRQAGNEAQEHVDENFFPASWSNVASPRTSRPAGAIHSTGSSCRRAGFAHLHSSVERSFGAAADAYDLVLLDADLNVFHGEHRPAGRCP